MMTNTAENILPFPSVPETDLLQFIDDMPMQSLVMSRPFFKASIPCVPPGINESYTIVALRGDKRRVAHTSEAKQFLDNAALILSSMDYGEMCDWDLFHAIGRAKRNVPLSVDMTFFFEHLWKRDIDGPIKITLDALFNHFKKVADYDAQLKWNDNRVRRLVVAKEVDVIRPRVEIEVRCLIQKTLGRAA